MSTKELLPKDIVAERLQSRASIDRHYVDEMAERMKAGDEFPPIPIIQNGEASWLPDGLQRLEAAQKSGVKIRVNFTNGTLEDARKMSLAANFSHGARRTNADKRKAATLALEWFPDLSNRALADMCKLSDRFIGEVRKGQKPAAKTQDDKSTLDKSAEKHAAKTTANRSQLKEAAAETRVGRDGKRRRAPQKPATASAPAATPPAKKSGQQKADVRVWDRLDDLFGKMTRLADDINREFPHANNHRQVNAHFNSAYAITVNWRKAVR